MQRLEFNGAVRLIYRSLGVKGLKEIVIGSFPEPDVLPSPLRSSKRSLSFTSNRNPV